MAVSRTRSLLGSLALHAGGVAVAVALARRAVPDPQRPALGRAEVDFVVPPAPVVPPPPAPQRTPSVPVSAPQRLASARRTPTPVPVERPTETPHGTTEGPGEIQPAPVPTVLTAPPVPGTGPTAPAPRVTAADLLRAGDDLAVSTAALGPPVHAERPSRNIYGGSAPQTLQQIAAGPTLAMLAETQHMLPAGATVHDRAMARRAAESFLPARTVPGLGQAVLRAPVASLPPISHTEEREQAVNAALDAAHPQSFSMLTFGGGNTRSFHLVRADVEVDQAPSGAVLDARVVRPSGVAGFDAEAVRAIREAVDEVPPLDATTGPRRTRWAFEVSDGDGVGSRLLGNANEGWTPVNEASQGVRLRMRVRRISSQRL